MDEEKTDKGADDHREIRREREVADARAPLRGGQDERRQGRRRRRADREFDAVQKAQRVQLLFRMREAESQHEDEEGERRAKEQPALVETVDQPARKRAAGDGADLEKGHGKSRFQLAALHLIHDADGKSRDEDILCHEMEEVRGAQADEFSRPELFPARFIFFVQCFSFFLLCFLKIRPRAGSAHPQGGRFPTNVRYSSTRARRRRRVRRRCRRRAT